MRYTNSWFRLFLCFYLNLAASAVQKPNVVLIVCDDLNDYIECLGGHPQALTPNIDRLSESGVCFTEAHCTIPICAPSRSSFLTGLYPHTTKNFGFDPWHQNEILKNSRTMMDHFRANGYHTLGTGKLMHHLRRQEWNDFGHLADYGPFAFDGTENVAHPDVPPPYRNIGTIDGSFGPLINISQRRFADGKSYSWKTGNWKGMRTLHVTSPEDHDPTGDELNGQWAVKKLKNLAEQSSGKPFFMGVGFLRPHTPLIVPKRFFDQFPLESIELPVIKPGDVTDTHSRSIRDIPTGQEPDSERTEDMGTRLFNQLVASYDSKEEALKRFIQAYLACVAAVDELVGQILDVIDNSSLKENTIIIFTSDHGWGMGEKDYLYKNSLWQESTQVPLIIRAPGMAQAGGKSPLPVSLIDLYPTLIDLCNLTGDTKKNDKGRDLDGFSLRPLLEDPESKTWAGPKEALTALYKWASYYNPTEQSYALRSKDWRYIRYSNGKEELYHHAKDPYEWTNLADSPEHVEVVKSYRSKLTARLPKPTSTPTQNSAAVWKERFFKKHPQADTNKDGTLSWPELKAYQKQRKTP